jgi:hypothetical protein
MAFEATFCIITVALVSGAVVERMRFGPFLVFAALWSVLVYAVLAHWAFGGGWLQSGGTLDFAGGIPVEMCSGFSALAAALVVGARKELLSGMGKYVNEIALVFVEHPKMRKYSHEGFVPCGDDRPQAEAIAIALANALDHVLVHLERVEGAAEESEAWKCYCRDLRKNSPVMRELLCRHPDWYCRPLREVFCDFSIRSQHLPTA